MNKSEDVAIAKMYIARSEGKIIQEPAVSIINGACWDDMVGDEPIGIRHRIKPQTVGEAAEEYSPNRETAVWDELSARSGFIAGAQWQKDQDNE